MGYYRSLARLKNTNRALKYGNVRVTEAGEGRLCFIRAWDDSQALVCVNQSSYPMKLPLGYTLRFGRNLDFDGDSSWLESGGFCLMTAEPKNI